jgi:hypothetical protein
MKINFIAGVEVKFVVFGGQICDLGKSPRNFDPTKMKEHIF